MSTTPLARVHANQQHWPGGVRLLWWALLLPLAIAAWAACRSHGLARIVGYAASGVVLLFGLLVGVGIAAPAPIPSASVSTIPAAAPIALPAPTTATSAALPAPAPLAAGPFVASAPSVAPTPRAVAPRPVPTVRSHRPAASTPASVAPPARAPSSAGTYTNSDGNRIERPDGNASGATAICRDGTDSHSAHRSGTCSGHGGVAQWL